jgi:hypothetical protein
MLTPPDNNTASADLLRIVASGPLGRWTVPALLFVVALVVRFILVLRFPDPAYPDAFYYVDAARRIADGHGLTLDFVWNFVDVGGSLPAVPSLPIAAFAHWMPLASFVQVPFLLLFGHAPLASDLPFLLIGSLVAPLTYALGREMGLPNRISLVAGILAAIPLAALPFMGQADNYAIYTTCGASALWMGARGLSGRPRSFALGGLFVGFATLSRDDGVLLGLALALIFFADRLGALRHRTAPRLPIWAAFACFALFLLIAGPWFARQLAEFGTLSPSAAGGRSLWLRSMAELNSITTPTTPAWFFGQGIGPLLTSRVLGFVAGLATYGFIICAGLLFPFVVASAVKRRSEPIVAAALVYAAILFAAAGTIFSVHVPHGMFLHSAVAFAPVTYLLGADGVDRAVRGLARRRPGWNADGASRFFLVALVGFAIVTGSLATESVQAGWSVSRNERIEAAAVLATIAPHDQRVLTADSAGFNYFSGRSAVVTTTDDIATIHAVAIAYGLRWLVLERSQIVPAMVPILTGTDVPSWIGSPVWSMQAGPDDGLEPSMPANTPVIVIYPICPSAPVGAVCTATSVP